MKKSITGPQQVAATRFLIGRLCKWQAIYSTGHHKAKGINLAEAHVGSEGHDPTAAAQKLDSPLVLGPKVGALARLLRKRRTPSPPRTSYSAASQCSSHNPGRPRKRLYSRKTAPCRPGPDAVKACGLHLQDYCGRLSEDNHNGIGTTLGSQTATLITHPIQNFHALLKNPRMCLVLPIVSSYIRWLHSCLCTLWHPDLAHLDLCHGPVFQSLLPQVFLKSLLLLLF